MTTSVLPRLRKVGIIDSMDVSLSQLQEDGEGQGSLACCSPWARKEPDTTEQLNNHRKVRPAKVTQPGSGSTRKAPGPPDTKSAPPEHHHILCSGLWGMDIWGYGGRHYSACYHMPLSQVGRMEPLPPNCHPWSRLLLATG